MICTDGISLVMLLSALWPDSSSNAAVEQISRAALSAIKCQAKAKGMLRNFQYLNYAAPFQAPLASYGAENLEFLQQVSKKYDPTSVFQRRVPGGFKLVN